VPDTEQRSAVTDDGDDDDDDDDGEQRSVAPHTGMQTRLAMGSAHSVAVMMR
jgi:hypothetical protein